MASVLCQMCKGRGTLVCSGETFPGSGELKSKDATEERCSLDDCSICGGTGERTCPGCLGAGLVDMPLFA